MSYIGKRSELYSPGCFFLIEPPNWWHELPENDFAFHYFYHEIRTVAKYNVTDVQNLCDRRTSLNFF